jgi:hypothetical protein
VLFKAAKDKLGDGNSTAAGRVSRALRSHEEGAGLRWRRASAGC